MRVEAASVCGTDLHIDRWDEWSQRRIVPPLTLGHEFAGTVVELGQRVRHVAAGRLRLGREPRHLRRVLPLPHRPGAHVRADAHPRRRPRRRLRASTSPCPSRSSGRTTAAKLPPEIATLQEPFGNAVFATGEQELAGRSVAVLGCGPIGLFAIGIARASGAAVVLAADRTAFRLDLAAPHGRERGRRRREPSRTRPAGSSSTTRASASTSSSRCPARRPRDRRRLPDRAQRRPGHPLRHPVAAGRDRRRRGDDLQEPRGPRAQRPPDLRDLVQDALDAGERRRRPAAADHPPAPARAFEEAFRAAPGRRGLQDRPPARTAVPAPARGRGRRRGRSRDRRPVDPRRRALRAGARRACAKRGTLKRFNELRSPQGAGRRDGGAGRGARALLEQLPRPGRPSGGRRGRASRGCAATARARRRCASSAAPSSRTSSWSASSPGFVGTEAALTYVSCWNANEAVIPTLTDEHTVILSDALNHASIIDAIRLSRPAREGDLHARRRWTSCARGLESCAAARAEADRDRRRLQHGRRPRAACPRSSSWRASTTPS